MFITEAFAQTAAPGGAGGGADILMSILPFLLIFVCGYFWAGFSTLWQEHQAKLRCEREARKVEVEAVG